MASHTSQEPQSKLTKAAWVAIVVACFSMAIYMITGSYKEWQESPVSTTISTHPISELEFPTVTVCPPRGLNTALNRLLEKVKDVDFTDKERGELVNISREVFVEIPNQQAPTGPLLSLDNMTSIAMEKSKIPKIDDEAMITIESSEVEGRFCIPGCRDRDSKLQKGSHNKAPPSIIS